MIIFRQKADRLPITIFTLFFLLDLFVFFTITERWFIVSWFLFSIYFKGNICSWNHHHQHVATFKQTFLNRLLEIMYGFQTGATSKAWTLHHVLGHHRNYLDQSKDESAWMRPDGKTMNVWEYIFKVTGSIFFRIIKVGKKWPNHLRDYLMMLVLQLVLLALFFSFNWFNALFIFALPMVLGLALTVWATYDHHSNLDTQNEFEGSRNILDPLYNLMTGNLGYHTAHHIKQGIHWSKLPEFHEKIAHKIPSSCYLEAGFPYSLLKTSKKALAFVFMRRT